MGEHRHRKGRVEAAREHEHADRHDIRPAERAALRAQAFAVDLGELARDGEGLSTANAGYLRLRQAAGLTSGGAKPVDAFDELLRELTKPGAGASDASKP